jgi:hypothetical protein
MEGLELIAFDLANKKVILRLCENKLEGFSVKIKNIKTDTLRSVHSGLLKNPRQIFEGEIVQIGPFEMNFRKNREDFVKANIKAFCFEELQGNEFYENTFKSILEIEVKEETYFDAFFLLNKTNQFFYQESFKNLFNQLLLKQAHQTKEVIKEEQIEAYFQQENVKTLFELDLPILERSQWVNAKQKRQIILASKTIDMETKKELLEDIEDIFEELENLPRYIIATLEQFEMFYLYAGESLSKSEFYWKFYLKITYILLFFKNSSLKELASLNEKNLAEFAKGVPQPWQAFLYENAIELRREIQKIQKRNSKKALKKDFLLSTKNAYYRAINRDLSNSLELFGDSENFSITARSFQRRG